MFLRQIKLFGYRNIASAQIDFKEKINIIRGENANGKTNIAEAIFMFAGGRSFRAKNAAEAIRDGEFALKCAVVFTEEKTGKNHAMEIEVNNCKLKKYAADGAQVKKLSEFIGIFRAVLFTPDHLSLIKGVPEGRRRFLDMAVSQLRPVYISFLSEYNKIIANRNKLLRDLKTGSETDCTELSVWSEQAAKYAATVTRYRSEYIKELKIHTPRFYSGLSGGREQMAISYIPSAGRLTNGAEREDFPAAVTEKMYLDLFNNCKSEEIRAGSSLFGPHRDDLYIEISNKSARAFASQGQQRSAVLALKLAEGEISKAISGEYPVFILDDILSELDGGRRSYLIKNLGSRQVIITCCSDDLLPNDAESGVFTVKEGKVISINN